MRHRFQPAARLRGALLCACAAAAACDTAMTAGPDGPSPPDGGVACTVTAPTSCPAPAPRYADVQPIFARRCVSCHSGQSDLWPLISYDHVAAWYDTIRDEVLGCTMPPPDAGVPITNEERGAILTWLRCGFPP